MRAPLADDDSFNRGAAGQAGCAGPPVDPEFFLVMALLAIAVDEIAQRCPSKVNAPFEDEPDGAKEPFFLLAAQ